MSIHMQGSVQEELTFTPCVASLQQKRSSFSSYTLGFESLWYCRHCSCIISCVTLWWWFCLYHIAGYKRSHSLSQFTYNLSFWYLALNTTWNSKFLLSELRLHRVFVVVLVLLVNVAYCDDEDDTQSTGFHITDPLILVARKKDNCSVFIKCTFLLDLLLVYSYSICSTFASMNTVWEERFPVWVP